MKLMYFDTETTGLNDYKNDIIQLGYIVEIDGVIKEEGSLRCAPRNWDAIDSKALEVTGITKEELRKYPEPMDTYYKFLAVCDKYISKFDKEDKFTPVGFNTSFDCGFLKNFFYKAGNKFYGSYFNWRVVDALSLCYYLHMRGQLNPPDFKLKTICTHFGIELKAHDALCDIRATRELLLKLNSVFKI